MRWRLAHRLVLDLLEREELGLGRGIHAAGASRHAIVLDKIPELQVRTERARAVAGGGVGEREQDAIAGVLARLEYRFRTAAELLHAGPATPVAVAQPIDESPEARAGLGGESPQRRVERRVDQHVEPDS